jgi:hypothetical protein
VPKAFKTLFETALEFCTIKDIHALLSAAKESGHEVKLTAPTLAALVNENLRAAIDAKGVSVEAVYDLIREAEENGRQHIYYYRPAAKDFANVPISEVGTRLWGPNWAETMHFPRFELKENGFTYADLRQWNPHKKPLDWALKVYGQQLFEEQEGDDERIDERTIKRTYILQPRRLVLLLRWNSPDLLEIRVPQSTSRKHVKQWLDQAWVMAAKVFRSDNFTPWDLNGARRALVNQQAKFAKIYRFSHSRLEDDDHNMISISSAHTEQSLEASTPIVKSMQDLVKPGIGECRYLRVTWLPTKDGVPAEELVSYLGDQEVNEIGIGRRCSAPEIDYVTEQLQYFSKPDPGV